MKPGACSQFPAPGHQAPEKKLQGPKPFLILGVLGLLLVSTPSSPLLAGAPSLQEAPAQAQSPAPAPRGKPAAPSARLPAHPASTKPGLAGRARIRAPASDIRITPNPAPTDLLTQAYQALVAGQDGPAGALYARILAHHPHHPDAMNGLAALALRQGQYGPAAAWYQKALAAHPQDVTARVGLLRLKGEINPTATESALHQLLQESPEACDGYQALGILLADQARWGEAREAFQQANTCRPGNPNTLLNLAVSLDHLGKNQARDYYRQALQAGGPGTAHFDREGARARLAALEGAEASTP